MWVITNILQLNGHSTIRTKHNTLPTSFVVVEEDGAHLRLRQPILNQRSPQRGVPVRPNSYRERVALAGELRCWIGSRNTVLVPPLGPTSALSLLKSRRAAVVSVLVPPFWT